MSLEAEFKRKKLSKFLAQELLYEFATDNLDEVRRQEMTEYLGTCRDTRRELENLNKGLRFAEIAAQVTVVPALHHALENFEPQWKSRIRAWTLRSFHRGWRTLPYAVLAAVTAAGVLVAKPWIRKAREDVTLAEQLRKEPDMLPGEGESPLQTAAVTPSDAVSPPVLPTGAPSPLLPKEQPQPASGPAPKAKIAVTARTESQSDTVEAVGRGFLYRAAFQVQDFQNSWPAIRDKIVALGGKVAGNVELGWLRKPSEAYFHFTLPESNLNELEIFLKTFGPVQFSKNRHPRVMPEGQIRIIMSIKDGMTHDESPPETP